MLDKILIYNYCLSAYLAGAKKKNRYSYGTWFFFAAEYLYLLAALSMFILSIINYTFPDWGLLLILILLWYLTHYRTKKWVFYRLEKMQIEYVYKNLTRKKVRAWLGLLAYVLMFAFFFVAAVLTFEGYSLR